jgi:anti-sigma factor RsiW
MQPRDGTTDEALHLDDLALMLLADGEGTGPDEAPAAQHVAGCPACAARLASLIEETQSFAGLLALDETEVTFLQSARLPEHAMQTYLREAHAEEHNPVTSFLLLVTAIAIGYAGWVTVAPRLGDALELARRAGFTSIVAHLLAGWIFDLVIGVTNLLRALSVSPLLDGSLLLLSVLAGITWMVLISVQRSTPVRPTA